jgi:hypothetical protein
VDLALGLLDLAEFKDLRNCIYTNTNEFNRFRSTIITIVLATDIMDKQLGALRKERWAKAFNKDTVSSIGGSDDAKEDNRMVVNNRKATIVLEHLIQVRGWKEDAKGRLFECLRLFSSTIALMTTSDCLFFDRQASDVAHTMQHWHVYGEFLSQNSNPFIFVRLLAANMLSFLFTPTLHFVQPNG